MSIMPSSLAAFDTAMLQANAAKSAEDMVKTAAQAKNIEKTRGAAKDFEAMFVSEMLSHMFSGLDVDPMFGGGRGEEMFRSMMVQEYGKKISHSGRGIGLADDIQRKMIEMQQQADSSR